MLKLLLPVRPDQLPDNNTIWLLPPGVVLLLFFPQWGCGGMYGLSQGSEQTSPPIPIAPCKEAAAVILQLLRWHRGGTCLGLCNRLQSSLESTHMCLQSCSRQCSPSYSSRSTRCPATPRCSDSLQELHRRCGMHAHVAQPAGSTACILEHACSVPCVSIWCPAVVAVQASLERTSEIVKPSAWATRELR